MNEYFAGVGIFHMIKECEKKRDALVKDLITLLDDDPEKTIVWDYVFEEKPSLEIWEDLIKNEKIKIGRLQRKSL